MISRRDLLQYSGLAALAASWPAFGQEPPAPDFRIDIAPLTLDLSPLVPELAARVRQHYVGSILDPQLLDRILAEGWSESKVIARFWIMALVFALFALTTLKLR